MFTILPNYAHYTVSGGGSSQTFSNVVYTTGDQSVTGRKIFADLPTFNSGFYFGSGINQYWINYDNVRFRILTTGGTLGAQWNGGSSIWDFNGTINLAEGTSTFSNGGNIIDVYTSFVSDIDVPKIWDSNQVQYIDVNNSVITDINNDPVIDWGKKQLLNNDGSPNNGALDWNIRALSGSWSISGSSVVPFAIINSLSGWVNNTQRISSISVTGFSVQTGLIKISGVGDVVVHTGFNNFIYISGINSGGFYPYSNPSNFANSGDILSTGQQSWNAANNNAINLSGRLTTTGQSLYQYITSLSGVFNSTPTVTGISVTGFVGQTGLINISGVGNVVVLTGVNNFIYISGINSGGFYPYSNPSNFANSGDVLSTGQQSWNAANNNAINLSGRLTTTGQSLYQYITSLSGVFNSIPKVTGISVTGFVGQTGLINISGLGSVTVLTGINNFIYISGSSTASSSNIGEYNIVYKTGDQSITGTKYFSGLIVATGIGYKNSTRVDIINGILKDTANGFSIDWMNKALYDNPGNNSLDWNVRQAYDSSVITSIDWENRTAIDNGGVNAITWNSRELLDNGSLSSVAWQDRWLVDSSSTVVLDWDNHNLIGTWSVGSLNLIDSLSGWVNNTSRASAINVTGFGNQTGVIRMSGLGSVVVLTGANNSIFISGSSVAGTTDLGAYNVVFQTGAQNINNLKTFSGVQFTGFFSGNAITGYNIMADKEIAVHFTGASQAFSAKLFNNFDESNGSTSATYLTPLFNGARMFIGSSTVKPYSLNLANLTNGIESLNRLSLTQYLGLGVGDVSGNAGGGLFLENYWPVIINGNHRGLPFRNVLYDNSNHASLQVMHSRATEPTMIVYGYSGSQGPSRDILQLRHGRLQTVLSTFNTSGYLGLVNTSPTAYLHLGASVDVPNSGAPIKFTSGLKLSTIEKGAFEYDGTGLYITNDFSNRGYISPIVNTNVYTQSTGASICTINWASGNVFHYTLSGNTTFNFAHDKDGQTISLAVRNTGSNGGFNFWTCTWPASVRWPSNGSVAPSQTSGAFTDVYTFIKMGTGIFANVVQSFPNF